MTKTNHHTPQRSHVGRWLTEAETASRLNLSVKWLQKQRLLGGGPRFAKFGSAVRYAVADLEVFEQLSLRLSTSDPGPAAIPAQGAFHRLKRGS